MWPIYVDFVCMGGGCACGHVQIFTRFLFEQHIASLMLVNDVVLDIAVWQDMEGTSNKEKHCFIGTD